MIYALRGAFFERKACAPMRFGNHSLSLFNHPLDMTAAISKRLLLVTVSLSLAALAPFSPAAASDDVPIATAPRSGPPQGSVLARILPKLEPFESDEVTVYAERLATLSPASRVSTVALAPVRPETSFSVRAEPSYRLNTSLDRAAPTPATIGSGDFEPGFSGEVSAATESPVGLDIGFTQRASLQTDAFGERSSRGAEVRIGRRLRGLVAEFEQPTWDRPTWYFFAASDGQALTWTPNAGGSRPLRVQDRVTVGDIQAGLSIQASGLQASLTYLQREVSNAQRSDTQHFAGVSLTLRR